MRGPEKATRVVNSHPGGKEHIARVWTGHQYTTALCGIVGSPLVVPYSQESIKPETLDGNICKACLKIRWRP